MKRLAIPALLAAASAALAATTPIRAQEEGGDRVNTLIVYGDDECPQSTPEEITVCARMDEGERFRIPQRLRQSQDPANEAWASRVRSFEAVGDFGPLSCSPVGAGGELGCTAKMIENAYAERAQSSNVRFGQLIAEAREERLSTIDEEAAATQARVEELEREYMARQQAAEDGAEGTRERSVEPQVVDPAQLARPPE